MSQNRKNKKPSIKKESVALRQEKVFDLMIRGLTQERIAEALGVDRRTIVRDFEIIRDNLSEEISKLKKSFKPEQFWAQYRRELEIQKKEMYAALAESKGDRTMVIRVLKEINEEYRNALTNAVIKVTSVPVEEQAISTLRIIHEHK